MKIAFAAVSALALAATPALAQGQGNNGNGNGNGNRDRGGPPAQVERGNPGNGNANRGNRGNGPDRAAQRGNPGNGPAAANRGNGNGNAGNRGNSRGNGNGNRDGLDIRIDARDGGNLIERVLYRDAGVLNGCPPGLARKRNGCMPPGQARQLSDRSSRYSRYSPDWWGLPYSRGNYFYDDGFLLQYDGNRISGYIPLLGGALAIGNTWPSNYGYDRVPDYYDRYYGLGDSYRYADNVVYRLDPETAAIASVAALLTGDEFVVGSPMPRGYDVYNVPYGYRDRFRDGPDARYRYSDGYVYEIDPETMLVASAIELLL